MTPPAFWHPAEDRSQIWRTLLGLILVAGVLISFSLGLFYAAALLLGMPVSLVGAGKTPMTTAVYFLTFLGIHLGLALVLPLLHRRGYTSLFGPDQRLNLHQFLIGAAITLAIAAALYALLGVEHLVLPEGVSPTVAWNLTPAQWVAWLFPALALILVQVCAEEALFRGYLLQQLRARFHSSLAWAVLPSLAFGFLHYDPATYGVANASAYVLNATVLGTIAAFVTLRTGNLAAAVGLHFGNNATLVLFGLKGSLDGFSLFSINLDLKSGYTTYSILTQTAAMMLVFVLWWRWMNRHRPIANDARAF